MHLPNPSSACKIGIGMFLKLMVMMTIVFLSYPSLFQFQHHTCFHAFINKFGFHQLIVSCFRLCVIILLLLLSDKNIVSSGHRADYLFCFTKVEVHWNLVITLVVVYTIASVLSLAPVCKIFSDFIGFYWIF